MTLLVRRELDIERRHPAARLWLGRAAPQLFDLDPRLLVAIVDVNDLLLHLPRLRSGELLEREDHHFVARLEQAGGAAVEADLAAAYRARDGIGLPMRRIGHVV